MEIMQVLDLLDIQERFSKSYLLVGVFSNMKAIKKKLMKNQFERLKIRLLFYAVTRVIPSLPIIKIHGNLLLKIFYCVEKIQPGAKSLGS